MSYRIGSFNMYKFSFQSDKGRKKNFETLAAIIQKEEFDIVAMQEVFSEDAIRHLLECLNGKDCRPKKWDYRWAAPKKTVTDQAREGYAFIWNKSTMELAWTNKPEIKDGKIVTVKHTAEPHIFDQYHLDPGEESRPMLRNPYYGRFMPLNCFCEIRLLNTHIRFGKDSSDECSLSDAAMRKKEFRILTTQLYHRLSKKRYGNNLPSYTIILGDYNLNMNRSWTKGPYLDEIVEVRDNGVIQRICTVQDELTSLKRDPDDQEEDRKLRGFSNNYDHFSYDLDRFQGIYARARRIDTVRKYCDDDFAKHKKTISDHIPVALNLNLRNEEARG